MNRQADTNQAKVIQDYAEIQEFHFFFLFHFSSNILSGVRKENERLTAIPSNSNEILWLFIFLVLYLWFLLKIKWNQIKNRSSKSLSTISFLLKDTFLLIIKTLMKFGWAKINEFCLCLVWNPWTYSRDSLFEATSDISLDSWISLLPLGFSLTFLWSLFILVKAHRGEFISSSNPFY